MIIDLTPIRDGTGPARLLDMVEGRSKQVFKTYLGEQDTSWRDCVEVVAADGFTGFKTATSEELPDAVAVMDPFRVVRLPTMLWTSAAAASSRSPAGTAAAWAKPCPRSRSTSRSRRPRASTSARWPPTANPARSMARP